MSMDPKFHIGLLASWSTVKAGKRSGGRLVLQRWVAVCGPGMRLCWAPSDTVIEWFIRIRKGEIGQTRSRENMHEAEYS